MAYLDFMAMARGEQLAQQMNQADELHARKLAQSDFDLMRNKAQFDLAYPSQQLQQDALLAKQAGEMQAFAELGGILSSAASKAYAMYPNDEVARARYQDQLISEANQATLRDTTAMSGPAGGHALLAKLQQADWLRSLNAGDSVAQARIANTGYGTAPQQVTWAENQRAAANAPIDDPAFQQANGIRRDPNNGGYIMGDRYFPTGAGLQASLSAEAVGPDARMRNLAAIQAQQAQWNQRQNDQFAAGIIKNNDKTTGVNHFLNREGTSVITVNDPAAAFQEQMRQMLALRQGLTTPPATPAAAVEQYNTIKQMTGPPSHLVPDNAPGGASYKATTTGTGTAVTTPRMATPGYTGPVNPDWGVAGIPAPYGVGIPQPITDNYASPYANDLLRLQEQARQADPGFLSRLFMSEAEIAARRQQLPAIQSQLPAVQKQHSEALATLAAYEQQVRSITEQNKGRIAVGLPPLPIPNIPYLGKDVYNPGFGGGNYVNYLQEKYGVRPGFTGSWSD